MGKGLFVPEHQKLAADVVGNHNQHTGHQLPQVSIPVQGVYGDEEDRRFQRAGTAWKCTICGYIAYKDELPEGYKCPLCKADRDKFVKV